MIQAYFRHALQHPVMFHSIIALSRANLTFAATTNGERDRQVTYHYGSALSGLREMMAGNDLEVTASDATLFAIVSLMGIDYLTGDVHAFQIHLAGLRRLIAARGGLDALGWPTLLKPSIMTLEKFWAFLCKHPRLMQSSTPITVRPLGDIVEYGKPAKDALNDSPQVPYPAVSGQPAPGFARLAAQNRLSPVVQGLVRRFTGFECYIRQTFELSYLQRDGKRIRSNGLYTARNGEIILNAANVVMMEDIAATLASNNPLTTIEHVVVTALYFILLDVTLHEKLSPLYRTQFMLLAERVLAYPLNDRDPAARDLVSWIAVDMASTMIRDEKWRPAGPTDIRMRLIRKVVDHYWDKMEYDELLEHVLKNFIWADGCVNTFRATWQIGVQSRQDQLLTGCGLDVE
jgi:hypothetical protein